MNKLFLVFPLACCIYSCSQPSQTVEQKRELKVSLDTVRIDSKDEILFLNYFLNISSLDPSGDFLYNFNVPKTKLEKINLETLELDSLIQLEREGPNGIGGFPSTFMILADGSYLFYNGYTITKLDATGEKTLNLNLAKVDFIKNLIPAGFEMNIQSSGISSDGNYFAALYGDPGYGSIPEGILWVDLQNQTGKIISTDQLDFITENNIILSVEGRVQGANSSVVFFEPAKDKILLSSSAKNTLMIYDFGLDSMITKFYDSKITRNEPVPVETITVGDMEEFHRLRRERMKEVTFGKWYLDQETGSRWRFSKELDKVVGEDSLVYKTVVTGVDENLEMIGEHHLSSDFVFPYQTRIRKGMIYTFLNENDELAFIRLKPTFENE